MRTVQISAQAEADLRSILQHVARDSADAALRLVDRLTDAAMDLGTTALEHSLVPHHDETGLRRRVVGRYAIIYTVEQDRVDVLHIIHGARNLAAILTKPTTEEP
jgi:toxin ParE1/3/4